jgi:hypothetical protein
MRLESCWIGVIALAVVMTGQGCTKLDAPRADADLRAARQACDAQYPRQVGQYEAHARCVNEAIDQIALPLSEYPDLVKGQQATRMELSIRVDRGEISPEDAALVMARADTEAADMAHRRDAATTGFYGDVITSGVVNMRGR